MKFEWMSYPEMKIEISKKLDEFSKNWFESPSGNLNFGEIFESIWSI